MSHSVRISERLSNRLEQLAAERHQSVDSVLDEALQDYLDRVEFDRAFIAEARASRAAFEGDGQHVALDEAAFWLRSWGTPDETEAPKCHG